MPSAGMVCIGLDGRVVQTKTRLEHGIAGGQTRVGLANLRVSASSLALGLRYAQSGRQKYRSIAGAPLFSSSMSSTGGRGFLVSKSQQTLQCPGDKLKGAFIERFQLVGGQT